MNLAINCRYWEASILIYYLGKLIHHTWRRFSARRMAWISGSATARGSLRAYLVPLPFSILTSASARGEWDWGWRGGTLFVLNVMNRSEASRDHVCHPCFARRKVRKSRPYILTLSFFGSNCKRGWAKYSQPWGSFSLKTGGFYLHFNSINSLPKPTPMPVYQLVSRLSRPSDFRLSWPSKIGRCLQFGPSSTGSDKTSCRGGRVAVATVFPPLHLLRQLVAPASAINYELWWSSRQCFHMEFCVTSPCNYINPHLKVGVGEHFC